MNQYLAKYELNLDEKINRILSLNDIYKEYKFEVNEKDDPFINARNYLKENLGNQYILKNLYKLEELVDKNLNEIKNLEKIIS